MKLGRRKFRRLVDPWTGNRFQPAACNRVLDRCDRCGDVDDCCRIWSYDTSGMRVTDLCAWCWIAQPWDNRLKALAEANP